jgi:hypothetical protein
VWNFWDWQVLFGRSGGKRNGGLNILSFQAGKIGKDIFRGVAISQACEYGAQGDAGPFEHGLTTAGSLVPDDPFSVVLEIASCVAHVARLKFG